MTIKEYVLDILAEKIVKQSVNETIDIIEKNLNNLARKIVDENNQELKELYMDEYEGLNKALRENFNNITIGNVPLETMRLINQKINSILS